MSNLRQHRQGCHVQQAGREIGLAGVFGKRAATKRLASGGSAKRQRIAYSQDDAWMELSDGWYFIKAFLGCWPATISPAPQCLQASLDAELYERVRQRQMQPGRCRVACRDALLDFLKGAKWPDLDARRLHVCMASAVEFPVDGCDPLQLPDTARLLFSAVGGLM